MPTLSAAGQADIGGVGPQGRSFNFANLSAEAVSAVEVYKTARADVSSGGIGATINIKTARPLDNDGMVLNVGAKGVYDESSPFESEVTPEVNGIFSYANEDKTWGVGLNASYQKRHTGGVESNVNDWVIRAWDPADALRAPFNADHGDRERTGDGPALRHPERRALRVLGFRA